MAEKLRKTFYPILLTISNDILIFRAQISLNYFSSNKLQSTIYFKKKKKIDPLAFFEDNPLAILIKLHHTKHIQIKLGKGDSCGYSRHHH